ncbi:MAG: glycogen synthase GlgA [Elusimicrobia bacterium]|nr:glycogen synthase GlgA [Elusimicrobiota bacterium]
MRRINLFFGGLVILLSGGAAAQMRVDVPADVRLAASAPGVSALAPTLPTAGPLAAAAPARTAPIFSPSSVAIGPTAAATDPAASVANALEDGGARGAAMAPAAAAVPAYGRGGSVGAAHAQAAALFDGGRPLNVLMAGAEAVPFIKTGGLADVVDALSRGLAERGHRVVLVLPKYRALKLDGVALSRAGEVSVPMGGRNETARLWKAKVGGVDLVLLDHEGYYDRPGGPYQGKTSVYADDDNAERFAFYSRAALEAARALGFKPDIAHAHDWHAGLMAAYLKLTYGNDPFFAATRSVVTIHNLAFQGVYPIEAAARAGFSGEQAAPMGPLEYWGGISYLKGGLALADAVTTVSPTYAREIREKSEFGMGLEGVLNARSDGVLGILNGLDPELNDPRTDAHIARNYGSGDVAEGKAANKAWLQRRLGLEQRLGAPLFVVASRLAAQKGIDLVLESIDELVARGAQVVVTGSGDAALEESLAAAVARHPGQVAAHPFDEIFVHAVYAAADFLLMPSRFEPCGLSQLIAHRYGALPIVTPTGGLVDTVRDLRLDASRGDGIMMREFSVRGLVEAVEAAIAAYRRPASLSAARATAMGNDSSWGSALDAYVALYRRLTGAAESAR